MNIDLDKATQIVNKELQKLSNEVGADLKILEGSTIQRDFYYVFFYNSKLFLESKDFSYAVAGNCPLIVDKIKGNIYQTGTAYSVEFYMKEFEENMLTHLQE